MINSITIGSLLQTKKGEIIRVESISTKKQHRKVGYHKPNDPCKIHYVRLCQCHGIELKEGMLEANGIRFQWSSPWYQRCFQGVEIAYDYEDKYKGIYISLRKACRYVHEVQQVLYLCGLEELANNWKV